MGNRREVNIITDAATEIERANVIFEAIYFKPEKGASVRHKDMGKKILRTVKLQNSGDKSTSQNNSNGTSEKPSVTAKLEAFDKALKQRDASPGPHQGKAGSIMPAARLAITPAGPFL